MRKRTDRTRNPERGTDSPTTPYPTPREAPRGRHPSSPSLPAPVLPESRRWACALSLQCPLAVCLGTQVLHKCVRTEQRERTKQRTLSWLRRSPQSQPVPTSGLPTSNSKINAHRGARQDVASRLLTPRLPAPSVPPRGWPGKELPFSEPGARGNITGPLGRPPPEGSAGPVSQAARLRLTTHVPRSLWVAGRLASAPQSLTAASSLHRKWEGWSVY